MYNLALLGAVAGGNIGDPFSSTHAHTHINKHTPSLKHQITLETHSRGIDKSIRSIILILERKPNTDLLHATLEARLHNSIGTKSTFCISGQ